MQIGQGSFGSACEAAPTGRAFPGWTNCAALTPWEGDLLMPQAFARTHELRNVLFR